MSSNKMTKDDAARIQSTQDKGSKDMSSSGFAARAQSAGDKNTSSSQSGVSQFGNGRSGGTPGSKSSGTAGEKQN